MNKERHSSTKKQTSRVAQIALAIVIVVTLWSGMYPHDRLTWYLETCAVVLGIPILVFTERYFRFTDMLYLLLLLHAGILLVGGHYTYELEPFFRWLQQTFSLQRNYFDRLGHFAQGFVPTMIARELLIRVVKVRLSHGMLNFLLVSIALALSATYELLEWTAAISLGSSADSFLAIQGDVWDTQKDMAMALVGSIAAIVFLSRSHDRAIARMSSFDSPRVAQSSIVG